eukprot:CAMPEP_0198203908 /NCGR_PEP_ID=MMETSP1445-20131203/7241_1 /TAXON_ID=36898 /ORGANISM="Pyramimonas sp., Strain CCMP2087" /LENGTH=172 /DNA_ID=CAMNT_0043875497 /DNA_START=88 /DNA_END=603 /DNA_ORIENTATION=+
MALVFRCFGYLHCTALGPSDSLGVRLERRNRIATVSQSYRNRIAIVSPQRLLLSLRTRASVAALGIQDEPKSEQKNGVGSKKGERMKKGKGPLDGMSRSEKREWLANKAQQKSDKEVAFFWEAVKQHQAAEKGRTRFRNGLLAEKVKLFGEESDRREGAGINFDLYDDIKVE